jgi:arsenate reductase (glutaredoxin)
MSLPVNEDELLILHNPRCSKSRQTLAILEETGLEFAVRNYLEQPLDAGELAELGRRLDRPAIEWMRPKETAFAEAGLSKESPEAELIAAMAAEPKLMERPVVIRGGKAVLGRPPEDIKALL